MQQTYFLGMEPVPPSEKDITFLKTYMNALCNYLEEVAFCKHDCSSKLIANAVTAKGVHCFIDSPNEYGDTHVVIPRVRFFDIHITEETHAIYRGETGEVVYP